MVIVFESLIFNFNNVILNISHIARHMPSLFLSVFLSHLLFLSLFQGLQVHTHCQVTQICTFPRSITINLHVLHTPGVGKF